MIQLQQHVQRLCHRTKAFERVKVGLRVAWGDEQERAFLELKARLVAAPILRRPIRGRPFQLHTDWSMLGLGVMLTQCDDEGKEFVGAYASRSNNAAESHYNSYEGECLATVWLLHTLGVTCLAHNLPLSLITSRSSG
jgi:hypothetical protein